MKKKIQKSKSRTLILRNADTPTRITPSRAAPLVGAERVQSYIRSRFNPIRSLTPELLSQYLDAFKTGYLRQCSLVWDAIEERDYILSTVIPKRKAAAARHGWEILTLDSIADSLKTIAAEHKQALESFYNNLTVTSAIDENERGEVSLLLRQMMSAVGYRYAVHEIVWKPIQKSVVSSQKSESEIVNRQSQIENFLTAELRNVPIWFFENTKGKLRYLQSEGAIEGVDMEDGSWLVSVAQGIMTACSVAYIYKTMSLKDWVIYNERHGMPGIHGKTDAAKDSAEWDALVTAVQNFAADWAMVTNQGATIDKVDMATTGQLPYPPLVELMDRAMSALWRGADLSTISAGSGQGQGASLQGDESKTLEEDDAKWLSETLSRNLDRRVIEYTFGEGVQPLAYIKIKTAQKKEIPTEIMVDKFLIESGAPVGVKNTLERYNRPQPDPDDELLIAPSSTVPAISPGQTTDGDAGIRPSEKTKGLTSPFGPAGRLLKNRNDVSEYGRNGVTLTLPNSDTPTRPNPDTLVSAAVAETLGVRSEWLAPFFTALEEKARAGNLSDAELLDAIEAMAKSLPELMTSTTVEQTAAIVQKLLTQALDNLEPWPTLIGVLELLIRLRGEP